ncbi:hypothetical protein [Persephonella sp.]
MWLIKKWERQMVLPYWKWCILKILQFLSKKENIKKFFSGLINVFLMFTVLAIFYLAFILWGEDELKQRKSFNHEVKQDTTYYKADKLPQEVGDSFLIHNK